MITIQGGIIHGYHVPGAFVADDGGGAQSGQGRVLGSRGLFQGPGSVILGGFRAVGGLRRLFLEDGMLVSQPSPLGNAIKLRKSLAT